jgi:hypothetical protein
MAYAAISKAPSPLAWLMAMPFSWAISLGMTGMISPHPITSMINVMKINPTAACRLSFIFGSMYLQYPVLSATFEI